MAHSRHAGGAALSTAAGKALCVKVCGFLLHPKGRIKVMAGLLLPPNEPKLGRLKSSGTRPHSLSPGANLMVTATRLAQAQGSETPDPGTPDPWESETNPSLMLLVVPLWEPAGSVILDLGKHSPLFHARAFWVPAHPPAEHPKAPDGLGN